jgi:hypothetical protein
VKKFSCPHTSFLDIKMAPQTSCKTTWANGTSYVAVQTGLKSYFPGSTDFNIRPVGEDEQEHVGAGGVVNH